MTKSERIN